MISYNNLSAFTDVYLGSQSISKVFICDNQVFPTSTPPTPSGNAITYTASSKLNVALSAFTPSATAETYDNVTGVGTIEFDNAVTSLSNRPFYNSSSLTSIVLPDSVTTIDNRAFYNCSSLSSITIPDSVISIAENVFYNVPWWSSYSADTSHHYGGVVYINDVAYQAVNTSITSVTFKDSTKGIGGSAFYNCSNLSSVTIPDGVTNIRNGAFGNCTSLTSITIPNSVTFIDGNVFGFCTSLTSIDIPDSVTSIGFVAFQYCSGLTNVAIGSGVTSIGQWAFQNCTSLTSITVNATTPPVLGLYPFNNTNNCPIYVPSESLSAYQTAWSAYASRIQAING